MPKKDLPTPHAWTANDCWRLVYTVLAALWCLGVPLVVAASEYARLGLWGAFWSGGLVFVGCAITLVIVYGIVYAITTPDKGKEKK